jgi:antitoxin component of MazEF toxin-antitoxin module
MVAVRARLARQGNSTGLTFTREVLEAAGMERGADVSVDASEGRIVITPATSPYSRAMEAFDRSLARYGRTYSILAK